MNKGELVDAIAARTNLTKKQAEEALNAMIEAIQEAVASGDKVSLVGFGSFEPRDRAAREGRNPKSGEPLKIPAARIPAFSAGKGFKERVGGAAALVEAG